MKTLVAAIIAFLLAPSLFAAPIPGTRSFTSSDSTGLPQTTFRFQTQNAALPQPGTFVLLALGAAGLMSSRRHWARA